MTQRSGAGASATAAVADEDTAAAASHGRWAGVRVLLAEDHHVNQKVATMMLQNLGCQVEVAANGKEAVRMMDEGSYDLIFMDCEMPLMDGFAAMAAIRARTDGKRRVPIIAVTAKATQGDREHCLQSGMDDYISKPVHIDQLVAVLSRSPSRFHWPPEAAAA